MMSMLTLSDNTDITLLLLEKQRCSFIGLLNKVFVIYIVTVSNVSNIDSNPICEVLSRSLNATE